MSSSETLWEKITSMYNNCTSFSCISIAVLSILIIFFLFFSWGNKNTVYYEDDHTRYLIDILRSQHENRTGARTGNQNVTRTGNRNRNRNRNQNVTRNSRS